MVVRVGRGQAYACAEDQTCGAAGGRRFDDGRVALFGRH